MTASKILYEQGRVICFRGKQSSFYTTLVDTLGLLLVVGADQHLLEIRLFLTWNGNFIPSIFWWREIFVFASCRLFALYDLNVVHSREWLPQNFIWVNSIGMFLQKNSRVFIPRGSAWWVYSSLHMPTNLTPKFVHFHNEKEFLYLRFFEAKKYSFPHHDDYVISLTVTWYTLRNVCLKFFTQVKLVD